MASKKLARTVNVAGSVYGPDDDVPADVAEQITNPEAWEKTDLGDADQVLGLPVNRADEPAAPLAAALVDPVEAPRRRRTGAPVADAQGVAPVSDGPAPAADAPKQPASKS
jgi:hypothetical protein